MMANHDIVQFIAIMQHLIDKFIIEKFSSKIKQIHFWYFWEKQVSLTEFIHMSMGEKKI